MWRVRLGVRTRGSQPCNTGSIPVPATIICNSQDLTLHATLSDRIATVRPVAGSLEGSRGRTNDASLCKRLFASSCLSLS